VGLDERFPGAQGKARAMPWGDDFAVFDGSVFERGIIMCTAIFEGVQRATDARGAHAIPVHVCFQTLRGGQVGGAADVGPLGHGARGSGRQTMPVWRRAASVIIDWFQGGSNTSSTFAVATV